MKKLNARGFTAVEILLTITVLVLVSGVGWYIYSKKSTAENAAEANKNTSQINEEAENANVKNYTSEDRAYSISYPQDWMLETSEIKGGIFEALGKAVDIWPQDAASKVSIVTYKHNDVQAFINDFYGYTEQGPERQPEKKTINGQDAYYINADTDEAYLFTRADTITLVSFRSKQTVDETDPTNTGSKSFDESDLLPSFHQIARSFRFKD